MNYKQTIDFLYEQLPQFQKIGTNAYTGKLDNIRKLCKVLGNPEKKIRCIHIAGTNGKGSSSHLLASFLIASGHKTGLYTSPHLISYRERIRINTQLIEKNEVINFVKFIYSHLTNHFYSFFEITVAMAFWYFEKKKVSYAVIETGLGGEFDSTNVISPVLSLITNISYDHQAVLGDSLEEIAKAKAGIIKKNVPIVISESQKSIFHIFENIAMINHAPIFLPDDYFIINKHKISINNNTWIQIHYLSSQNNNKKEFIVDFPLIGDYQLRNLKGVLMSLLILGISINNKIIAQGFEILKYKLPLFGRFQILAENPKIVCDVAHNRSGIVNLMKIVNQEKIKQLYCIFGVSKDKNLYDILAILPKNAIYALCESSNPRLLSPDKLAIEMNRSFSVNWIGGNVNQIIKKLLNTLDNNDMLLIFGSFFIVSDIDFKRL